MRSRQIEPSRGHAGAINLQFDPVMPGVMFAGGEVPDEVVPPPVGRLAGWKDDLRRLEDISPRALRALQETVGGVDAGRAGDPGSCLAQVHSPPPARLPARQWRDLIRLAWHCDPLPCPQCQKPMRLIAVIDQSEVVEKILRHLHLWCGPARFVPGRLPPGISLLSEPESDHLAGSDPMSDYENVTTD